MDTNSRAPGICQKLINFIYGMVMINNRPRALHGSTEVPILEGSSRNGPIGHVSSDQIVVEFRHTSLSTDERGARTIRGGVDKRNNFSRKIDLKKIVTIQESEEGKEANRLANARAKMVNEYHDQDAKARPARRPGPLTSVASNINERSDAYIQRMKKAISRNDSFDHENS